MGNWNNNNGNNNQQQQQFKRSGAVYTKMKNGKYEGFLAVNAWKATKNGILKASAFPVSDVEHESKKGNSFLRYAVDITNANMGTKQTYWCLMNTKTQKIVIQELGMVISPNGNGWTKSGKRVSGYFGKNFRTR